MRISKILLLVSTLFALSSTAQADLLLEPYLGYTIGSGDRGNFDYDYKTPQIGGRVGYQMLGLMLGVDYSMGLGSFDVDAEHKVTGAETSSKNKKNQLGVFVGYNLPVLLRVWGTYYVNTSLETEGTPSSDYSGSGYALGAGFTGLPFVSLNLEYRNFSYDEVEIGSTKSTLDPELEFSEIFLSVSLPLTF